MKAKATKTFRDLTIGGYRWAGDVFECDAARLKALSSMGLAEKAEDTKAALRRGRKKTQEG